MFVCTYSPPTRVLGGVLPALVWLLRRQVRVHHQPSPLAVEVPYGQLPLVPVVSFNVLRTHVWYCPYSCPLLPVLRYLQASRRWGEKAVSQKRIIVYICTYKMKRQLTAPSYTW